MRSRFVRIIRKPSVAVGDHELRKGEGILDGQSISSEASHEYKAKYSSLRTEASVT
jgi:hypothetical protein